MFGGAVLRELPIEDSDDEAEVEAGKAGKSKKKSKKKGAKVDKKLENVSCVLMASLTWSSQ